jgi:hypothetical protein
VGGVEVDSPPPYGVQEGPDGLNSLLMPHLRLAYICRRRLMRSLALERHGCVAIVEEVC